MAADDDFQFPGFSAPNYTPVPDELFDQLLSRLSGAELKVLLYIMRRTFGFKKEADTISFNQICEGITTGEGRVLDHGTGLSKSTAQLALKGLVGKRIILADKRVSRERGNEPTTYRLRFRVEATTQELAEPSTPYADFRHSPIPKTGTALYRESAPQETGIQETAGQEGFEDSNGLDVNDDAARTTIAAYLADFARELHDRAPLPSSVGRAVNLYHASGLPLERFLETLYAARATTQRHSGSIKAAPVGDGPWPAKPKMAYFFAVLEDVLGQRQASAD